MTPDQIREAIEYLDACIRAIHEAAEGRSLEADEQSRFDEGLAERQRLVELLERHNTVATLAQVPAAVERGVTQPFQVAPVRDSDNPFDLSTLRFNAPASEVRARAVTAIEKVRHISDADREKATSLVERADAPDGRLARHILATGSDAYRSGFQKLLAGEMYLLEQDERQAIAEARAASLTNNAGGYAVPFTLDPTIIDTRDGYANPFRQVCRQVTITTDQWNGVSSAGVTASYAAEAAEVGDNAPTLAQPSIDVEKAHAFVPFSIEIGQDWASFEGDIRTMFVNAKDDLEAVKFTTGAGSGSNEPTGIITELDGGSSEIAPATAETFALADVYALEEALGPRYRTRASWMANKAVYNKIRQFDSNGGAALWERLGAGMPAQLLGYNAYENSAMDGSWNVAASADNFILLLGDFSNYVIVDRAGMSVELVPHLFATANNRPSGQRGFYAWWRNGAGSVNDAAFALLNLATTA